MLHYWTSWGRQPWKGSTSSQTAQYQQVSPFVVSIPSFTQMLTPCCTRLLTGSHAMVGGVAGPRPKPPPLRRRRQPNTRQRANPELAAITAVLQESARREARIARENARKDRRMMKALLLVRRWLRERLCACLCVRLCQCVGEMGRHGHTGDDPSFSLLLASLEHACIPPFHSSLVCRCFGESSE